MDTFKIDKQVLTLDDTLSILRALKGIASAVDDSNVNTAIEKIKNLVPDDRSVEMEEYLQHIVVDLTTWSGGQQNKEQTERIYSAISQKKVIKLLYRNMKGERTVRLIEPMTLVNKNFSWYLFAFCRTKNDFRLFKLRRIINAEITDEKFIRKEVIFSEYFNRGKNEVEKTKVVLLFRPRARYKAEEYFPQECLDYDENGCVIANLELPLDEWVYGMILSLGDDAEVISPETVRKEIEKKVKKILSLYKPDILLS
jgi:predicted DNA-binding transcriptional regulator YafY